MTVRRVMGIETEYGISVPGDPAANPMLLSGHVVNAYASRAGHARAAKRQLGLRGRGAAARRPRVRDGPRQCADPSQLTDEEDPTLANVVLTNGARLYVDHAHPEYSSPEVTRPRAAVTWDRAGELIMLEAVAPAPPPRAARGQPLQEQHRRQGRLLRHARELPDARGRRRSPTSCATSSPFFVARQVMCGSGRVGIGQDSRTAGLPDQPSAPTSSRSRSGWRRR